MLYRPSSSMVDYTDFEEARLREKMFPHYITAGPPQRREEVLREILIIIFRGGGGFLLELFLKVATMNE